MDFDIRDHLLTQRQGRPNPSGVAVEDNGLNGLSPGYLIPRSLKNHSTRGSGELWSPTKVEKFYPAICLETTADRRPEWYALRYETGKEALLFWCISHIGLEYRHLTFLKKDKRGKSGKRNWLPGYLFLNFDRDMDRWQQVTRMPHAFSFLGSPSPIPAAKFDDLVRRCPERLARPSEFSCVAPGTVIRILRGPLQGHTAVVAWSDRKTVKVPMLLFGSRDVEVTLKSADVEVVE